MKNQVSSQFDRLIFIVIILLVLIMAARMPLDSDLWWHLRAGEWTLEHGSPILKDYFSNSAYGTQWINHSWLSEVIFELIYQRLGFFGIGLLVSSLAAGSMIFVYKQMEGSAFFKAFLIVLASAVAAFVWVPRPEMFSLILLGWLGYVLYDFKWNQKKYLWQLPIIFFLWANLHGGYPLGLLLVLAYIGGETLNLILCFDGQEIFTFKEILELGGWMALSLLVLLLNPNGVQIFLVPFQTVGLPTLQHLIQEWASPDFHDFAQQVFLLALFAGLFLIGISGRRLDASDAALLIGFAYMAFIARRNFGPFAVAAIPVLSRHLESAFDNWMNRLKGRSNLGRFWPKQFAPESNKAHALFPAQVRTIINTILILVLALVFLAKLYWVTDMAMIQKANTDGNTMGAIAWLKEHHPAGKLLNEYNTGGYLVWALRNYPVFVDGRTDMYGEKILQDWINLVQADKNWDELMKKYDIGIVMVDPGRPLVKALALQGWQMVYSDEHAVILLPGK